MNKKYICPKCHGELVEDWEIESELVLYCPNCDKRIKLKISPLEYDIPIRINEIIDLEPPNSDLRKAVRWYVDKIKEREMFK